MRRKIFTLLLLAALSSGTVVITADTFKAGDAGAVKEADKGISRVPAVPFSKFQQPPADEPGMVDGSKNPELIPDVVAYSLLFRFVSGARGEEARRRVRHYVRQMGLGDQSCYLCSGQDRARRGDDRDLEAFLAVAEEFRERVTPLDQQVIEIKRGQWPNFSPAVRAELTRLQRQKDAVVTELVAALPRRLSPAGLEKVREHVGERMKRRIKMPAWQGWADDVPPVQFSSPAADE